MTTISLEIYTISIEIVKDMDRADRLNKFSLDLPLQTRVYSVEQKLKEIFPEQQCEEKNIKRAKDILGEIGEEFNLEELRDITSEIQYLVSSWLDDFEREIFNGLTLRELLHEKEGL